MRADAGILQGDHVDFSEELTLGAHLRSHLPFHLWLSKKLIQTLFLNFINGKKILIQKLLSPMRYVLN